MLNSIRDVREKALKLTRMRAAGNPEKWWNRIFTGSSNLTLDISLISSGWRGCLPVNVLNGSRILRIGFKGWKLAEG